MDPTNFCGFRWQCIQLGVGSEQTKQCKTLKDAVCNCASAIQIQIEDHVRKHEAAEEKKRELSEYNRKGQEWADKANSVSAED